MARPDPPIDPARAVAQHLRTMQMLGVTSLPQARAEPAPDPADEADLAPVASVTSLVSGANAKQAALDALREEHDAECPHCTVATAHTRTVFGEGHPDADLMFVGEAPGAEEDRQGRPFVGRSGQKLTEMINALGFERTDVYIANVLKSRPPNNATPTAAEAAKCGPYLARQIEIIQPKVIVALGAPATKLLLETREGITKLRGTWHVYCGIPVMPTFHPAYLLRQYTPENRRKVWSDLQAAREKLAGI
jgi:uracil-DNA glycosylase family 4